MHGDVQPQSKSSRISSVGAFVTWSCIRAERMNNEASHTVSASSGNLETEDAKSLALGI